MVVSLRYGYKELLYHHSQIIHFKYLYLFILFLHEDMKWLSQRIIITHRKNNIISVLSFLSTSGRCDKSQIVKPTDMRVLLLDKSSIILNLYIYKNGWHSSSPFLIDDKKLVS